MSGRPDAWVLAKLLALSLWCSSACSEAEPIAIDVQIATDLPLETLDVVSVQSLAAQGDVAIETGWFNIADGCLPTSDGFRVLGSFGIPKATQEFARILIVGYKRQPDNSLLPVVQGRLAAVFGNGLTPASVKLARSCVVAPACPADQTCGADTGTCQAVPSFRDVTAPPAIAKTCLQKLPAADVGRVVFPADQGPPACVTGDSLCPKGCDWTRDEDCLGKLSDGCDRNRPCMAGAVCVHNVCCNQNCDGECMRCDLPGTLGLCSHVPYTPGAAPLGEPDFQAQCVTDHAQVACAATGCVPSCIPGYGACDAPFATEGCKTKLGDAKHCRNCGEPCPYGYCGPDGCIWHHSLPREPDGMPNTLNSAPVSSGKLYTRGIATPPGDTVLRGFGALVHPAMAGRLLRIGLYVQTSSTVDLFAFTPDLPTVDRTASLVPVAAGTLRVESLLDTPKRMKYGDYYMIAFEVSDETQLFTTADPTLLWNVELTPYGELPQHLPSPASRESLSAFQVYVLTTPD